MKHCIDCNIKISSGSKTGYCISCSRKHFPVWNTGLKECRSEVLDKLSKAKIGKTAHNKGSSVSLEQRIKISCSVQGIEEEDFKGLLSSENKIERNKFKELNLSQACFELTGYSCDACSLSAIELDAHHKNSWKFFPDERFLLSNLVPLCTSCHNDFHSIYGNGRALPNTNEQYQEFKLNRLNHLIKKIVILVVGVSGSGKSWVCNQLNIKYYPYDKIDKANIRSIIHNSDSPTVVYDPTVHVSSFIKRNKDLFDIRLIIINENTEIIKSRLEGRGGVFSANVEKRIKRFQNMRGTAEFSGTSQEVLNYIKSRY